jgi:hypothetical protein
MASSPDGIFGPFADLRRLTFTFTSGKSRVAGDSLYAVAFWTRRQNRITFHRQVDDELEEITPVPSIDFFEQAYALATRAVRSFRTSPLKKVEGHKFGTITVKTGSASISLTFALETLADNRNLESLLNLLRSIIPKE